MRPHQCNIISPSLASAAMVVLAVLLATPAPSMAKRFDCQMFCRTTGFSGMVGGCRCSFTLFTAKRSTRDHNSVPEEAFSYMLDQQYPRRQELSSLGDYMRMAREITESQSAEEGGDEKVASVSGDHLDASRDLGLVQGLPQNHPVRLLSSKSNTSGSNTQHRSSRLGRSPSSQLTVKRREFEQDLDNGDTSDFLRLPY